MVGVFIHEEGNPVFQVNGRKGLQRGIPHPHQPSWKTQHCDNILIWHIWIILQASSPLIENDKISRNTLMLHSIVGTFRFRGVK